MALIPGLVVCLLAALAMPAVPAAAHSALTGVDPAEGSVLAQGTVVTLTFNEDLIEVGTEIAVTDAAGVATALEPTRPSAPQVAVTMPALADGPVTLAWRVVSADGHPIEGTLAYTAQAAPSSPSATPEPATVEPSETAQPSPTPSPSESPRASASATPMLIASADEGAESGSGAVPWGVWLGLALAVALGVVAAVVLRVRRA